MNRRLLFLMIVASFLFGCADTMTKVKKQGAVDLQCQEDHIKVEELPGGAYTAQGCGARITYKCLDKNRNPSF